MFAATCLGEGSSVTIYTYNNVIRLSSTINLPATTTTTCHATKEKLQQLWLTCRTSLVSTNQDWTTPILIPSGSNPDQVVTMINSDLDQLWPNISFLWSWQKPPQPTRCSASSILAPVPRTAHAQLHRLKKTIVGVPRHKSVLTMHKYRQTNWTQQIISFFF